MENKALKSQDIVVILQVLITGKGWKYEQLEKDLGHSKSALHRSLARCAHAHLMNENQTMVFTAALTEFLVHGIQYAFPAHPGKIVRGVATAHSAPPLNKTIVSEKDVYVWPYPKGDKRGQAIEPLHKLMPEITQRHKELYEMLTLIDAIRVGKAREKNIGAELLEEKIKSYASQQQ
ncbi:MAG: hypothetical protein NTY88_04440 [Bacteroidetes bacterium]|nr:hypothetical protein [Bacteroidota bacterium]